MLTLLLAPLLMLAPQQDGPAAGAEATPAFADICFDDFDESDGFPGESRLKELLAQVQGQEFHLSKDGWYPNRRIWQFAGLAQLTPAWENGTALRLSMVQPNRPLRLHLWRGSHGVTLCLFPNWYQQWVAYGTARSGSKPQPEGRALWATDEGRYLQSGGGTVIVLYQDGRLILARGDVLLLNVPLAEPPNEVYLEAGGQVRGLHFLKCRGGPVAPQPLATEAVIDKPAAADWKLKLSDGVALNKLADGAVELTAKEKSQAGQAAIAVCRPGLHAFVFEIEDAVPGTGVFVGDATGNQDYRLAVMRGSNAPGTAMQLMDPGNNGTDQWYDPQGSGVPFMGKHQWVQVLMGPGVCKFAVSGDGLHWSQCLQVAGAQRPASTHVGLYCVPSDKRRGIKLRSVQVRRFDALASLAELPADPALHQAILFRILDDAIAGPGEWDAKFRAAAEVSMLINGLDGNSVNRLADCYARLGQEMIRQGHPAPFTAMSRAIWQIPVSTRIWHHVPWEDLLTQELVPAVCQDRWSQVEKVCRRVELWQQPRRALGMPAEEMPLADLADWARTMLPRRGLTPRWEPTEAKVQWRVPLIPPSGKEGFTAMAEVEVALKGQAYRDACQIIVNTPNPAALGLVPDADRRLLVSWPVAVRLAMRRLPALRHSMEESFGPIGRLRLQGAIGGSDPTVVENVAEQFIGTQAAAEAQQWLGDYDVGNGQFVRGIGHYRQAEHDAASGQNLDLPARIRLAAALAGYEAGAPATQQVRLGHAQFSAAEFEKLVGEPRQSRGGASQGDSPIFAERKWGQSPPPPGRYQARPWARIDPTDVPPPPFDPKVVAPDWYGRQLAVTLADSLMIVTNGVAVTAYSLDNGNVLWQRRFPGEKEQKSRPWAVPLLRAVVSGPRVLVRRSAKQGLALSCLDAKDGRVHWTSSADVSVASDPILVGDDLLVLTLRASYPQKLLLQLSRLDPVNGDLLSQVPLVEFVDGWNGALPCQASVADDKIVATAAGCVLCCDPAGRIEWLRQQVWMPPREESSPRPWYVQSHEPPLADADRVYVTQPGMRSIDCLELASGRLVWQQTVPRLVRLVGLSGGRLIVATTTELVAFEAATGKVAWRRESKERLDGCVCGRPGGIVCVWPERTADENAPRRPMLAWLDPETGRTIDGGPIDVNPQSKPLFGPLMARGNRQWLLVGPADAVINREIWELVPAK